MSRDIKTVPSLLIIAQMLLNSPKIRGLDFGALDLARFLLERFRISERAGIGQDGLPELSTHYQRCQTRERSIPLFTKLSEAPLALEIFIVTLKSVVGHYPWVLILCRTINSIDESALQDKVGHFGNYPAYFLRNSCRPVVMVISGV